MARKVEKHHIVGSAIVMLCIATASIFIIRFQFAQALVPTLPVQRIATTQYGTTNVSPLTLTAGTTTTYHMNGTFRDGDGWTDVSQVDAVLYRSGIRDGSDCNANGKYCYRITNCTKEYAGIKNYGKWDCPVNMQYFADRTDAGTYSSETWNMAITLTHGLSQQVTFDTYTNEVSTLSAIGSGSSTIDFGSLELGESSSSSAVFPVTNYGNSAVKVNVSSTGMSCDTGTIDPNNQKFDTSDVAYATMSGTLDEVATTAIASLAQQVNDSTPSVQNIYWRIQVPSSGVEGSCSGSTNVVSATP